MPAHKKAFEVLRGSGAMEKNPQRFTNRKPEPKPSAPLGSPPKHLTDAEKKAWREIAKHALPGTLGNSDRIAVEIASRLLVRFRTGELIRASEISVLVSLLTRCGMTPVDRNKLTAVSSDHNTQTNDEWAVFSVRRTG